MDFFVEVVETELTEQFKLAERFVEPGVYCVFLCSPDDMGRVIISDTYVRVSGERVDLAEAVKAPLSHEETMAALYPPQPEPEPEPPVVRRVAARVEAANIVGFVPGGELAAGTIDSPVPAFPEGNSGMDTDRFGVLAFHLAAKSVVGAVTARISASGGPLVVGLYNDSGNRILQCHLSAPKDGGTAVALVNPPLTLEAGNDRFGFAWSNTATKAEGRSLAITREDWRAMNAGEGEIIVGIARGRSHASLPKSLGEIELPGDRFPAIPRLFFKG